MKNRFLGKSKIYLSAIGLGAWQFSKRNGIAGKYWQYLPDKDINNIVSEALNHGINWFDTAEIYGNGKSETALAQALIASGKPSCEIKIATKWNPVFKSSKSISKAIESSLKRLKGYPVDLYQIHAPVSFSSIKNEMGKMAILQKSGKFKYIGISNYNAKQMEIANYELEKKGLFLASNQVKYSLLNRKIENNGILDVAKKNKISIIAYSPLEQGLLTGKFHDNYELIKNIKGFRKYSKSFTKKNLDRTYPLIEELKSIANKHNATPSQIALSWIINYHGDIIFAIPGASSVQQAKQNAEAMNIILSEKEMERINEVSNGIFCSNR